MRLDAISATTYHTIQQLYDPTDDGDQPINYAREISIKITLGTIF